MTEDEIAVVLKAAADKLAEDMGALLDGMQPPTAEEVADYVLGYYTGLDLSRVTDMRAEFKNNGATLAIDFAYVPEPEYIIVNLVQKEDSSANGEAEQPLS